MQLAAAPLFLLALLQPSDGGSEREPESVELQRPGNSPSTAEKGSLSSSFYVRTDSDQTTILTPSVHFRKELGDSGSSVDIVYVADVWTSASVDIRTAASEKVEEQRDEINLGFDHSFGTSSIGIGYRFSHEVDYLANSVALSFSHEAFQRNSTIAARVFASMDEVGRSGDEFFSEKLYGVGAWMGWTQVLTKTTIVQASYEWRLARGYQASPYRWVPVGPDNSCQAVGGMCVPEVHPELKTRNAAVIRGRQSFFGRLSVGAGYRFYWDLWKIRSHTILADLALTLKKNTVLAADYRGYTQGSAFFYREQYTDLEDQAYFSRDRELSRLSSQRFGIRAEHEIPFEVGQLEWKWRLGLMSALTFYSYPEFSQLDKVRAFELSTNLGLGF